MVTLPPHLQMPTNRKGKNKLATRLYYAWPSVKVTNNISNCFSNSPYNMPIPRIYLSTITQVTMTPSASCSLARSWRNQVALLLSATSSFRSKSSNIRLSSRAGSAKTSFKQAMNYYNTKSVNNWDPKRVIMKLKQTQHHMKETNWRTIKRKMHQ